MLFDLGFFRRDLQCQLGLLGLQPVYLVLQASQLGLALGIFAAALLQGQAFVLVFQLEVPLRLPSLPLQAFQVPVDLVQQILHALQIRPDIL